MFFASLLNSKKRGYLITNSILSVSSYLNHLKTLEWKLRIQLALPCLPVYFFLLLQNHSSHKFLVKQNSFFYISVLCVALLTWTVENSAINTTAWIVQAVIFKD